MISTCNKFDMLWTNMVSMLKSMMLMVYMLKKGVEFAKFPSF